MITYSQKPNWKCAFKGATHILSVQDCFIFATVFGANGFKTEGGSVLSQFCVIEEKPSNTHHFYFEKPSWNQASKGATHIIRMDDSCATVFFLFATKDANDNFKDIEGTILNNFCVIEEKPSNGPVTIANTFVHKPDWKLAFVGATHIISVNNIGLQKITYHFAKKTGEQFTSSVGVPFTNVTVVDNRPGDTQDDSYRRWAVSQANRIMNRKQELERIDRLPVKTGAVVPVEINHRTEQIRNKLTKFIYPDEGLALRNELREYANQRYVPKFTSGQYFEFMNDNACDFRINGSQESNYPYYFTLFTVASQRVMGDCVEECLDKAIAVLNVGDGMTNKKPGRPSIKIPMAVPPIITDETFSSRDLFVTPLMTNGDKIEKIIRLVGDKLSDDSARDDLRVFLRVILKVGNPGRPSIKIPRMTPAEISTQTMFELEQLVLTLKREIDFLVDKKIGAALSLLDELSGGLTNAWQMNLIGTVIAVLKGEK